MIGEHEILQGVEDESFEDEYVDDLYSSHRASISLSFLLQASNSAAADSPAAAVGSRRNYTKSKPRPN